MRFDADSSLEPQELDPDFSDNMNLVDVNISTVGLNFRYMYSFVWKKFFV